MDVRCERCQTEYELEDANVSDLGTEVQCSDCGHRFVVKRPIADKGLPETVRADVSAATPAPVVAPFPLIPTTMPRAASAASPIIAPPMPSPGDSRGRVNLGAYPEASDPGETEIIRIASRKSRGFVKLMLTMLVAAVVAYAGIAWLQQRWRPAMISSAGTAEDESLRNRPQATTSGPRPRPVAEDSEPAQPSDDGEGVPPRGPAVQPMVEGEREERGPRGGKKAPAVRKAKPEVVHAIRRNSQPSQAQPGAPQALAAQGYAALTHRQYGQAVALFKRSLAGGPANGTALFGLAEAYRGSGQKMLALQTFRRYVEAFPTGPNAIAARTQVRLLEGKKH